MEGKQIVITVNIIAWSAPAPRIIDLGHEENNRTVYWPGTQSTLLLSRRERRIKMEFHGKYCVLAQRTLLAANFNDYVLC